MFEVQDPSGEGQNPTVAMSLGMVQIRLSAHFPTKPMLEHLAETCRTSHPQNI